MPDDGGWTWVERDETVRWTAGGVALGSALVGACLGFWVLAALGLGRVTGWW